MASRPASIRYKFPKIERMVPVWDTGERNQYPFYAMKIAWAFQLTPRAHQTYDQMATTVRCSILRYHKDHPQRFGTRTIYLQGVRYLEVVRIS